MNKSVTRIITALLSASILLSTFGTASVFAADNFKNFTEIAKMNDIKSPDGQVDHKMTAAEGFTIYGNYAYSVKVSKGNNDKYVTFYKTNLIPNNGKYSITQMKFTENTAIKDGKSIVNNCFYKDKIGHANDMVAANINGHLYLFVACGRKLKDDNDKSKGNSATNSFVQLEIIKDKKGNETNNIKFIGEFNYTTGFDLTKLKNANNKQFKGIDISGIDIIGDGKKNITDKKSGTITFLLKGTNNYKFYTKTCSYDENGNVKAKTESGEVSLKKEDINKKIQEKDKDVTYKGMSGYTYQTQGIYCHDNKVYMPLAAKGDNENGENKYLNKSVVISFPFYYLDLIYNTTNNSSLKSYLLNAIKIEYTLKDKSVTEMKSAQIKKQDNKIVFEKKDFYQFEVEGCAFANNKMYFCANRGDNRDMIGYIN